MKRFFALALCALFACQAEARTLYVDAKRPNNNGNGLSAQKAKKTIQAAINVAKKGDTILVAPGTYAPIKTNNKKIVIKSIKGQKKTKIVKSSKKDEAVALAQLGKAYTVYLDTRGTKDKTGVFTKGTKSTLEGFLLDGVFRTIGSYGKLLGVSGGTVKSCTIQRIGNKFADTYGGFPYFAESVVAANAKLQDCTVKNNRAWSLSQDKYDNHDSVTFLRCKIQNNDCSYGIGSGSALYNCLVTGNTTRGSAFSENTLVNCTVVKNTAVPWWENGEFSSNSKFYNCILWNNHLAAPKSVRKVLGYDYYDADGNNIGYRALDAKTFWIEVETATGDWTDVEVTESTLSRYYPGFTKEEYAYTTPIPGTVKKLHNVDAGNTYKNTDKTNKNPKFVSAAKGNYKLKKGSYCINKGKLTKTQKKQVGKTDLAGKARIRGKAVDRGCYEY